MTEPDGPRSSVVTTVLHFHARMLGSLWLWMRGRQDVPAGAIPLGYGRDGQAMGLAMGLAMLAVSVAELIAVELLVPWEWLRLALLVLGVYGLVVVLGALAEARVRPHVLTGEALRLRLAGWADLTLPLSGIAAATRPFGNADGMVAFTGDALVLATGGQTQVELGLRAPRELWVGRRRGSVTAVRFSVDDPAAAAAAIRAALPVP